MGAKIYISFKKLQIFFVFFLVEKLLFQHLIGFPLTSFRENPLASVGIFANFATVKM